MKIGLLLMKKNVPKPLAKTILIPLGLTAATSAVDAGICIKVLYLGTTRLIISNKVMEDIMKMVKSEEFVLLLKGASKTIENEKKKK